MTEEEFAEWQRRHQQPNSRVYTPQTLDYGAISGAVPANERPDAAPTCCQPPKRPKYGNKRVEVDGIKFDSKHEAEFYQYLMLRVRAGELKSVLRQVKFDLSWRHSVRSGLCDHCPGHDDRRGIRREKRDHEAKPGVYQQEKADVGLLGDRN